MSLNLLEQSFKAFVNHTKYFSDPRADHKWDLVGDGLTALLGLNQGVNDGHEVKQREYEMDRQSRLAGPSVAGPRDQKRSASKGKVAM
ncbi:hypothetical protein LOK49_LG02G00861 [Camellia lanceoleosa]|uniref:Uncharacterized protein n=1 Tax=Camellia lanceoleosa TaxID=1840588 RepID=A0ACC0IJU9_9ERIC|nr:hypothetical protein LOK49_LG02G00861 [Camellia lanceoleosa]